VQDAEGCKALLAIDDIPLTLHRMPMQQNRAHVVGRFWSGLGLVLRQVVRQLPYLLVVPHKTPLVGIHRERERRRRKKLRKTEDVDFDVFLVCGHLKLLREGALAKVNASPLDHSASDLKNASEEEGIRVASTQNTKTIFAGPKGDDFLSSKIQASRNHRTK
jgi:hypothetical protein